MEPWPVSDNEGYYQSYKEDGRWVNWWLRDYPDFATITLSMLLDDNTPQIPSNQTLIDSLLPVQKPYWLRSTAVVGKQGIRATWLGHASVLAEVDGTVVLCDPVLR